MDILLNVVITVGASILVAALLYVITRHRGEKVQNDLHSENQQDKQEEQRAKLAPDIKQVNAYLAEHGVDHALIVNHFETWRNQFNIGAEGEEEPDPLLVERLNALYDNIDLHIKDDNKWLVYFSAKDRHAVLVHHREWREIQYHIEQMIDLTPK